MDVDLTLTPRLLIKSKTAGSRKNMTTPSIAFGTPQTATASAIAVIKAAKLMEYVNLWPSARDETLEG